MTDKDNNILKLKVDEAIQGDINKGIVRIDSNLMKKLDIPVDSFVEIEGQRKTVCLVERGLPGDMHPASQTPGMPGDAGSVDD